MKNLRFPALFLFASLLMGAIGGSLPLSSITGLGTNVATALGVNVGSSGAVLVATQSNCTVTLVGTSVAGTTQTYNNQSCTYEQSGRIVTMRFDLNMSSLGNATGNVTIGGLPVAPGGGNPNGGCFVNTVNMNGTSPPTAILLFVSSGDTALSVFSAAAAPVALSITQAGAALRIAGTCIYRSA